MTPLCALRKSVTILQEVVGSKCFHDCESRPVWVTLSDGAYADVGSFRACISRYFLKASALDFPRPWVWKTVLSALPVWLAFGQFWRVNHGAHLGALIAVFVALAGTSVAVWALWREYGRAATLRGAQEAHSQFLAAAETSLDAFGLLESVRDDAGEIVDFRILYVNANAERLVGTAAVRTAGTDAVLGDTDPADEPDVCQVLQGGRFRRTAE